MSRNIGGFISLLCLLPVIIILGCGGGDSREAPFTTSLQLKDSGGQEKTSFPVGERITFVLSIRNNTSTEQALSFRSSQKFDIIVLEPGTTRIIWRWSNGVYFTTTFEALFFDPQETKIFMAEWDQRGSNGVQVDYGEYASQGIIVYDNVFHQDLTSNQFRSEMETFDVF